jgi:hemerythrin superfamily protein
MTTTEMKADIVDLLKRDHQEIADLLGRIPYVALDRLDDYFTGVVRQMVGHEFAEELVVYPFVRCSAPYGEDVASQRLREQDLAERKMAQLQRVEQRGDRFVLELVELRRNFLAHAQAEEDRIFPLLFDLDVDIAWDLADRYTIAKRNAPTHPHPLIPNTPPGNLILGPLAAIYDKTRDASRH